MRLDHAHNRSSSPRSRCCPRRAAASSRQFALFQDDAAARAERRGAARPTLDELKGLGVDMIKVQLHWAVGRAAADERKPSGFDGARPVAVPAAGSATTSSSPTPKARGFKVMFALSAARARLGHARPRGDAPGRRPARRARVRPLRGGGGAPLPGRRRVDDLERAEPPGLPLPAVDAGRPAGRAAPLPRRSCARRSRGLRRGGPGDDPILFGELLPIGEAASTGRSATCSRSTFLRESFCLDSRQQPLSGASTASRLPPVQAPQGSTASPTTLHAERPTQPAATTPRSARSGASLRVLDQRARAEAAIAAAGCRSGTPSSASRPTRPTRTGAPLAADPGLLGAVRAVVLVLEPARQAISQYTMNDQPGVHEPLAERPALRERRAQVGHLRELPPADPRAPARPGRGRGARRGPPGRRRRRRVQIQQRGRKGRYKPTRAARYGRATCAATSSSRFRISKAARGTFHFTTGGQSSLQVKPVTHLPMTLNPIVTLRRIMTRFIACLAAAVVVAGCGLAAAPQKSEAAVLVGIGEQDASMFTDPLFTQLGFKRARYFPSWNVALKPQEAALARPVARRRAGARSRAADLVLRRARLGVPEEAVQAADGAPVHEGLQGLPQALAAGEGDQPLERGEPPLAADVQEPEAGGAVLQRRARELPRLQDHRGGRDRRDEHGALAARSSSGPRRSRASGASTTTATRTSARASSWAARSGCCKAVKGEVWLTETGGIVKFVLPNGAHAVPVLGEPRQQRDEADVRAREALPQAHQAALHLPLEAVRGGDNRFDAGLIRADGTARPAYNTVRNAAAHAAPSTRRHVDSRRERLAAGAAVLRHRCAAGPRGAARGGARRRGGHGPAPRQGGERRRARSRGRRVPAAVRRARRAVLAERPAGSGWRRAAPTACTWARTTCRPPRRGRRVGPRRAGRRCRRTRPSSSTARWPTGVADQLSVGPVWETPTKEGRPAAGLTYVRARRARRRASRPGSRSAGSTSVTSAR